MASLDFYGEKLAGQNLLYFDRLKLLESKCKKEQNEIQLVKKQVSEKIFKESRGLEGSQVRNSINTKECPSKMKGKTDVHDQFHQTRDYERSDSFIKRYRVKKIIKKKTESCLDPQKITYEDAISSFGKQVLANSRRNFGEISGKFMSSGMFSTFEMGVNKAEKGNSNRKVQDNHSERYNKSTRVLKDNFRPKISKVFKIYRNNEEGKVLKISL